MKADRKLLFLVLLFLPIGKAAGQLQSSIIGGREALPHSRPYMVSIHKGDIPACGGVLVHKRWVLTAAHCYSDLRKGLIRVLVGLHRQPRRNAGVQVFTVAKFVPHPSFNRTTLANDIMLLKLDRKVVWNKETRLLPLSKKNAAPGTLCSVAGWGRFREGSKYSPVLRELNVKVMDIRMCNNSRYWDGEVTSTMMCFEGVEKGSAPCQGDSGGPVVCGKKAEVAGVISFTDKSCVNMFKPPVATAVFKYKTWIKKYLRWS
ncbi:granzyme M-like isoform X1 [Malaclemys terrapin pileata]|uniref:granzyme M-like isoform X1 n=2 Tax=Malaclemys terrapin pileata TaxID=2991368 RepID=UPI0023A81EA2|nr:granzyme M-like isoform X1 [Malaclemys terrapin pileata]